MKLSKTLNSLILSTFVTAASIAGSASAAPLYQVDTLLGAQMLGNSSPATEAAAFSAYGVTVNNLSTYNFTSDADTTLKVLLNPGTTDQWYIDLGSSVAPGYFLLKFGTGGTHVTQDTYFFKNVGEMSKLVFSNTEVNFLTGGDCADGADNRCNILRLSHYAFGGQTDVPSGGGQVPEPASLMLVGLGLIGVVMHRRRQGR